jgi:hypothetical protein
MKRALLYLSLLFTSIPADLQGSNASRAFYDDWCGGRKVEFCTVSATAIVARPEVFLGRRVSVSGYLRRLYDQWAIFPTLAAACHWQAESAIEIKHAKERARLAEFSHLDGEMVYVRGTVVPSDVRAYDLRFLVSIRVGEPPFDVKPPVRASGIASDVPPPELPAPDSSPRVPARDKGSPNWLAVCSAAEPR